jgi:glycosyltransferase involved in cell wall biosynthesis
MRIIKVQLDFNITKKVHSLYHSFFNNPPEGVEYLKSEFIGINEKNYSNLGKVYKKIVKSLPFINKFHQKINDLLRKDSKSDLIHFTFHFGNTKKSCVVDYETAFSFIDVNERENKRLKRKVIRRLNKKNVKYLMPIHKDALKSFRLFFGDKVKKPQEIVYPTIFIPPEFRKRVKKKNQVVFVSTSNIVNDRVFLIKGGLETISTFERLSKKYSMWEFIILGKVPKYLEKKFPKNMTFKESVPREEMWDIFNQSKIFVQPCYQAPAMAFLEAMWFKLPIVTYNCWGNNEYVDESNGIIIHPKEINHINKYNSPDYSESTLNKIRKNYEENSRNIENAIEKLIKNRKLREKLGNDGFKRVSTGKFSIDKKNERLRRIYIESLK